MKNKKGILNRKLLDYYSDINLKNYRKILFEAMDYYEGNNFSKVLDIGCGVGSFIESINFLKIKAIGLEGSDIGLNKCKEKK
jgi:2-polyprenyl-3-methyl-5-hydroxy-6-metoxy-1,4-benzoquinol methylase